MDRRLVIGMLLVIMVLSGCGAKPPAYTVISAGSLSPGNPIPVPSGEVILTLSGKISTTNQGNQLLFDMNALERLKIVEIEVDDPFLKEKVKYSGFLLQDLLDLAGYDRSATFIRARAVDEYMTDIPLSVLRWPIVIATKRNGKRMLNTDKGPLEIIFPNISYANEIDPITYNPKWVWQLREIEVRQ